MSTVIESNLRRILTDIERAAALSGRHSREITLVAVSKNQSNADIVTYCDCASVLGLPVVLGESYLQEFKSKRVKIPTTAEIHLIGPLQSNKARDAVAYFDLIQSVHSMKILTLLSKEAGKISKMQRVLLQVNVSSDPNKSGFLTNEIEVALHAASCLPNICVEGLMTITALYDEPESARGDFSAMRQIAQGLGGQFFQGRSPVLSMGMSADYSIAIEEGGTMVRVGTALFGERM